MQVRASKLQIEHIPAWKVLQELLNTMANWSQSAPILQRPSNKITTLKKQTYNKELNKFNKKFNSSIKISTEKNQVISQEKEHTKQKDY